MLVTLFHAFKSKTKWDQLFILVFLTIIFSGILLRFYNLRANTIFDWDQENSIALPAQQIIKDRDIVLIGAKTGVGDLYIGPLYSYLAALFFAIFQMDPIAAAVLSAFIATFTIIFSFYIISDISSYKTALIFAALLSSSSFLTFYDRIPWNVNLMFLFSLCMTVGFVYLQKNNTRRGWIFIGIGAFLGINSHFSVVLFLLSVLLFMLLNRKYINKHTLFFLGGVGFGILPLLLFEIKNRFLLSQKFVSFLTSSTTKSELFGSNLLRVTQISLETMGRSLLDIRNGPLEKSLALFVVLAICIFFYKQKFKFTQVFLLVIGVIILGYSLYGGALPEYYFLGLIPFFYWAFAYVFMNAAERYKFLYLLILVICIQNVIQSYKLTSKVEPTGLYAKQSVVQKIKEHAGDNPVWINYSMDFGKNFGFNYLTQYYDLKIADSQNEQNIYWLALPASHLPFMADYKIGDYALAYPQTTQKILNTQEITIQSEKVQLRIVKEWKEYVCTQDQEQVRMYGVNPESICKGGRKGDVVAMKIGACMQENFIERSENFRARYKFFEQLKGNIKYVSFQIYLNDKTCARIWDLADPSLLEIRPQLKYIVESVRISDWL